MSDSTEQNKSEEPTLYKLQDARRKGSVARGADLGFLTSLATMVGCLWFSGESLLGQISEVFRRCLIAAPQIVAAPDQLIEVSKATLTSISKPMVLIAGSIFMVVVVFELIQTGVVFSTQPLKPDFSKLNPAKGLKRLFTVKLLIETVKNVLKMGVYVGLAWIAINSAMRTLSPSIVGASSLAFAMKSAAFHLLFMAIGAAILFAAFDQGVVRREFFKQMRMSRREIRRESRDREGDPRLKQKRKQLHAEFVEQSQSLRGVRGADLVVTNPTHYAVAIRYDAKTMAAPTVVSQGYNQFAARIKRLAFIYGVVVIESPELARALFRLPINSEIPEVYFKAVAKVYIDMRDKKQSTFA